MMHLCVKISMENNLNYPKLYLTFTEIFIKISVKLNTD